MMNVFHMKTLTVWTPIRLDQTGAVRALMSLVDYVIAHEACHWRSLETIMPDYEDRLRRLDKMGHLFIW